LYQLIILAVEKNVPFSLKDQISRAMLSVILNFSEGYRRYHSNDKKNFYINARTSLNEVIACFDMLEIHTEIKSIDKNSFENLSEEIQKMLSGLINSMIKN